MPKQRLNDVGVVQAKRLSALHILHDVFAAVAGQSAVTFPATQMDAESVQTVSDGHVRISAPTTPTKQVTKVVSVKQATPDKVPHDKHMPLVG